MSLPAQDGAAVSALFEKYFDVAPADTPELLDAAYMLRYQMYCVENHFLSTEQEQPERETDSCDPHSKHAVLIYQPTGAVVGCVRLILPLLSHGLAALPVRALLTGDALARLNECDPRSTAEISRYSVSKQFRRREGEQEYPDVAMQELAQTEVRRLVPHISLGLFRAIAQLASDHEVSTVCAAMSPALLRLLERFGFKFELLGEPIQYHGLRQPCVADVEDLLAGLANRHAAYAELVEAALRSHRRPHD